MNALKKNNRETVSFPVYHGISITIKGVSMFKTKLLLTLAFLSTVVVTGCNSGKSKSNHTPSQNKK